MAKMFYTHTQTRVCVCAEVISWDISAQQEFGANTSCFLRDTNLPTLLSGSPPAQGTYLPQHLLI